MTILGVPLLHLLLLCVIILWRLESGLYTGKRIDADHDNGYEDEKRNKKRSDESWREQLVIVKDTPFGRRNSGCTGQSRCVGWRVKL